MSALRDAFAMIRAEAGPSLKRGFALSFLVLAMGAALLGLSGWFITAAGAAGLAGIGIAFDVFRPSAGVRLLALGRAAARYGERLLTHDATLRALEILRVRVLERRLRASFAELSRMRPGPILTRITADVDALDGLVLRLVLPGAAFALLHLLAAALLSWLAHWSVALWLTLSLGVAPLLVLKRLARKGFRPSVRGERAGQALRVGVLESLRGQVDAIVFGSLQKERQGLDQRGSRLDRALSDLERADEAAEMGLSALALVALVGTLILGGHLVSLGTLTPAQAAIGLFVSLALPEVLMPLRRGVADLGRMRDSAARLFGDAPQAAEPASPAPPSGAAAAPILDIQGLSFQRAGAQTAVLSDLSLRLSSGETLAIMGRSGSGKSTLLQIVAGLETGYAGRISLAGARLSDLSEETVRETLTLVTQRAVLVAGSVRDNLAMARPGLSDAEAWQALEHVALAERVRALGGLDGWLGERGNGLSGGETRRLVLARAILRQPRLLLLDEPTEGLDEKTAEKVLSGIRSALPESAILIAAHRPGEIACSHAQLSL